MTRTYRKSGKYFYVVSDTTIPMGSSGSRTMYDISIIGEHERASVKAISDDFCFVCELYNLIADEKLYPEHLRNVVEDYLAAYNPKIIPFRPDPNDPRIG